MSSNGNPSGSTAIGRKYELGAKGLTAWLNPGKGKLPDFVNLVHEDNGKTSRTRLTVKFDNQANVYENDDEANAIVAFLAGKNKDRMVVIQDGTRHMLFAADKFGKKDTTEASTTEAPQADAEPEAVSDDIIKTILDLVENMAGDDGIELDTLVDIVDGPSATAIENTIGDLIDDGRLIEVSPNVLKVA